jgi:polysaccharide deacetylase family protein (PEP-CTERM system associated)
MNILTFDIEDWWAYDYYRIGKREAYLSRLNNYLSRILDVLDEKKYKATFFCLGTIAREYPEIIKLIDCRNHEIACHSDIHAFLLGRDQDFFYNDTKQAIDSLEQVIGKKVIAYRAPAFSFNNTNKWVFEILFDLGITIDCSIFPAKRSFGGFPEFKEHKPVLIRYGKAFINEFPMSLTSVCFRKIAYTGGGYFRLFPYSFIRNLIEKNDYVMTYFHIRDFDYEQEKVFWTRYFQSYYGIKNAYGKFLRLLDDVQFIDLRTAVQTIEWDNVSIIKL